MNPTREWLKNKSEAEDACLSVTAGDPRVRRISDHYGRLSAEAMKRGDHETAALLRERALREAFSDKE